MFLLCQVYIQQYSGDGALPCMFLLCQVYIQQYSGYGAQPCMFLLCQVYIQQCSEDGAQPCMFIMPGIHTIIQRKWRPTLYVYYARYIYNNTAEMAPHLVCLLCQVYIQQYKETAPNIVYLLCQVYIQQYSEDGAPPCMFIMPGIYITIQRRWRPTLYVYYARYIYNNTRRRRPTLYIYYARYIYNNTAKMAPHLVCLLCQVYIQQYSEDGAQPCMFSIPGIYTTIQRRWRPTLYVYKMRL